MLTGPSPACPPFTTPSGGAPTMGAGRGGHTDPMCPPSSLCAPVRSRRSCLSAQRALHSHHHTRKGTRGGPAPAPAPADAELPPPPFTSVAARSASASARRRANAATFQGHHLEGGEEGGDTAYLRVCAVSHSTRMRTSACSPPQRAVSETPKRIVYSPNIA